MKEETIKYKAPLTYYGGKQRIAVMIQKYIPEHHIYCEPFFGGGAVFFAKKPSYLEIINDHNENLINFYEQIQTNFEKLATAIGNTLHSESQYRRAVAIYNGLQPADDLTKAVSTWIVFNQSWNSSARAGWKFDFGTGGSHIAKTLAHARRNFCTWIKKRLQYVQISCRDALQVIKERDTPETFFYLDPPYPGTNQGHYSGYSWENLEELLTLLAAIKGKFMLSNYPSDMISKFSAEKQWTTRQIFYKKDSCLVQYRKSQKTEVLLMNYQISVPQQLEIFQI